VNAPQTNAPNLGLKQPISDLNRAAELTPEVAKLIDDMFDYHPWAPEQTAAGVEVRQALAQAVAVIVAHVPPSPDRSTAIRKLREARMDANSAITHRGRY
jgi:DNA-binding IclR family transcriptional regulator